MPRAAVVFVVYLLLTLAATWPLARGLSHDVPWDLGDPLLVMWVLAWDCEQILAILRGDFSRIAGFFDANIFFPTPLTLAYSEHFVAQAVQILPVYAVTGNPILAYNLLFLSTFVLSGFGMYLLVRELTGSAAAGLVAGLMFAFAPYRLPQAGHLHVLSSQWMPFVLFGLKRYFSTRRLLALAGAALALVLQNLSSGYYLLLFSPMAVVFALLEINARKLWRDYRMWRDLSLSGLAIAALTLPFLLPYAALRAEWSSVRSVNEVIRYSADVYSYVTAFHEQRIWGSALQTFPKPEGELFPGLLPLVFALLGLAAGRSARSTTTQRPAPAGWLTWLLAAAAIGHIAAAVLTLALRRVSFDAGWFELQITNINQMLLRSAVAFGLLLTVSPGIRARVREFIPERGFFFLGLVAVLWLSLGPTPQAFGRSVEIVAPYRLLFDHVPGFDGLRVPARLAMIAAFMLAALAGYGAQAVGRLRGGGALLVAAGGLFLLEATHLPFTVNGISPIDGFVTPEARIRPPRDAPAVYHDLARQPQDSVLVELPFGQADYDLRAVYYSTVHWRPLVNGYSGFFPPYYGPLAAALSEIPRHPDLSLEALRASGATHAIVHEGAYRGTEGQETSAVLRGGGAVELFRDGSDVLLLLPR